MSGVPHNGRPPTGAPPPQMTQPAPVMPTGATIVFMPTEMARSLSDILRRVAGGIVVAGPDQLPEP